MAKDPEKPAADEPADDTPGPLDRAAQAAEELAAEARVRAARAAAEATVEAAAAAASKVAHGVLDGLETLLFGKVGAAEEAARAEVGDPLDRLRAKYADKPAGTPDATPSGTPTDAPDAPEAAKPAPEPARPPREDPVARARAELDALKAARDRRASGDEGPPIKKTL